MRQWVAGSAGATVIDNQSGSGDEVLARRAQQDRSAFIVLYDRHVRAVFRYLYSRCGDAATAQDLTSQTFLAALESLPRFQAHLPFVAWLFGLARHKVADHWRRASRWPTEALDDDLPDGEAVLPDLDDVIRRDRLRDLIRALPEGDKELIRLRYVADLSFAHMAVVLGKREDAVKKSLYRLQQRLRLDLEVDHA